MAWVSLSWSAITVTRPSSNAPATRMLRFIKSLPCLHNPPGSLTQAEKRSPFQPHPARLIPELGRMSEAMAALMFADRNPDPLRGRRHVDVVDFVFAPQPLDDRVDDRWAGADRAGLACALHAHRVRLTGDVVGL